MFMQTKNDYEKFLEAFNKRYKTELETTGPPSEKDMLLLYFEFKASGKTPEQWLEEQEQN